MKSKSFVSDFILLAQEKNLIVNLNDVMKATKRNISALYTMLKALDNPNKKDLKYWPKYHINISDFIKLVKERNIYKDKKFKDGWCIHNDGNHLQIWKLN